MDADFVERLDRADAIVKSNPEKAVAIYDGILAETENMSPRALYGKARAKDQLSEKNKSNALLKEAIELFKSVLELGEAAPDALFRMAGVRCAERMQFRGWGNKAIAVLQKLIARFPEDSQLRNDLGVQYLMVGHNRYAKEVFERDLKRNPGNGFASAHLGFVLKSEGDLAGGAMLLQQGIASGQEGAAQGKFYYHLGEAFQRLGRKADSDKVFSDGVAAGIFPSFWQRSLYNVDGLMAKPVWTLQETSYEFGLKVLQFNWEKIKAEAMALLRSDKFEEEGENLRDTGRWGQYDLYSQGKITANCKEAVVTCALIEQVRESYAVVSNRYGTRYELGSRFLQIAAAKSCTRGQVKFSVMYPGTHVHPHTGPTNCRLRAHLGLSVDKADEEKMTLRVADKTLRWREGEVFVFDDSFEHEVRHDGQKKRVVLIVDLWHPDLSEEQRKTLSPI